MIFTPNDILAAYMQAALSATSFTFKDTTTIQSFGSILALPHPKESEYTSCDTTLLNQTLETVLSSIHTQYLASL
jgi:phenylalanyl-tRNA synthetase beta subunit